MKKDVNKKEKDAVFFFILLKSNQQKFFSLKNSSFSLSPSVHFLSINSLVSLIYLLSMNIVSWTNLPPLITYQKEKERKRRRKKKRVPLLCHHTPLPCHQFHSNGTGHSLLTPPSLRPHFFSSFLFLFLSSFFFLFLSG